MTQKTHTPGPWEAWPDFDEDGQTGWTIIGTADGYALFCTCGANPADISLCLAAPEMLQALKTLREDMEMLLSGEWEPEDDSIQASIDVATAAITKAKGGAT